MTSKYSALAPLGFLLFSPGAQAQSPGDDAVTLDRIRVQATRLIGVDDFDTPASVDTVELRDDDNGSAVNVADALGGVPGLLARDRQNYAQDTQLSIRGFGARSTFGVRGVRLSSDGIPASMPDGQGQLSHFSALGGERIEIMRGPFSALYGNSSGGVVQLWSAEGKQGDPWRIRATAGSDEAYTLGAQLRGAGDRLGYNIAASRLDAASPGPRSSSFSPASVGRSTSATSPVAVLMLRSRTCSPICGRGPVSTTRRAR